MKKEWLHFCPPNLSQTAIVYQHFMQMESPLTNQYPTGMIKMLHVMHPKTTHCHSHMYRFIKQDAKY